MYLRIFISILLIFILTGCATTKTSQSAQVQQLQSRVKYLESEVDRKNKEISFLDSQLGGIEENKFASGVQASNIETNPRVSIRRIQTALKSAGFYSGSVDGKEGRRTRAAIRSFQESSGLKVDGIVGSNTWLELKKYTEYTE